MEIYSTSLEVIELSQMSIIDSEVILLLEKMFSVPLVGGITYGHYYGHYKDINKIKKYIGVYLSWFRALP